LREIGAIYILQSV